MIFIVVIKIHFARTASLKLQESDDLYWNVEYRARIISEQFLSCDFAQICLGLLLSAMLLEVNICYYIGNWALFIVWLLRASLNRTPHRASLTEEQYSQQSSKQQRRQPTSTTTLPAIAAGILYPQSKFVQWWFSLCLYFVEYIVVQKEIQ
jgi:hypothetical protein